MFLNFLKKIIINKCYNCGQKNAFLLGFVRAKEECIVECKYNILFKKWVPIKEGTSMDTILDIN